MLSSRLAVQGRDCFLFGMNRVPTEHIIPSTLGFQRCLRPLGCLERSKPGKLQGASLPTTPTQFWVAQQPASISAKLSHPATGRSPARQQQQKQNETLCVAHASLGRTEGVLFVKATSTTELYRARPKGSSLLSRTQHAGLPERSAFPRHTAASSTESK